MEFLSSVLLPSLAVGALALFFGILLAVASKIFALPKNERLEQIRSRLPGANCGGCGFAGCAEFAKAVSNGSAPLSKCAGIDPDVRKALEKSIGISDSPAIKQKAFVRCTAKEEQTKKKYHYDGVADCYAASLLGGGENACVYRCAGLGSCLKKCAYGALSLKDGVAVVDRAKCVGCGACLDACPKGLIVLLPEESRLAVGCASLDKGNTTKKVCSMGCLGCGICQKVCEQNAISLQKGVAVIDQKKCIGCGLCSEKCPRKTVRRF